ncbi:poly-gamma-glutamate synthase PgsB [Corynebacterium parakroppenstedtii]|uniref:poly-gamma-glutamate synthase PgsB n=1 Tax=Corynebacterium parakroppenstedtii TaxID=2828363 RepID=UPI0030EB2095
MNEQYDFLKQWLDGSVNGLVVECMAVKPKYQNLCQNVILRSPISIITNVRLDHQEEMGDTIEEIADSLCNTVPEHGVVITGERNEKALTVIRKHCAARNSRLIVAKESELSASLVDKFSYQQFEENIAVVLALAEALNIDTDVAVRGMLKAEPDPGTTKVIKVEDDKDSLYWVPMFAVNDWESTTKVYNSVHDGRLPDGTKHVIAMNNRADRTDRASMFVDVITKDLKNRFDQIVLYGDIQDAVYQKLIAGGITEDKISTTTDIEETDGKALVARARESFDADATVAVYGMVNIHTQHVQSMEKYISTLKSENALTPAQEHTGSVEVTAPKEAVTDTNTDVAAGDKHAGMDDECDASSRDDEHVEVMA